MFKQLVDWFQILVAGLVMLTVVLLLTVEPTEPSGEIPDAAGATVFESNCAGCHGAAGEGGVGPALAGGLSRFESVDEVAAFVSTGVPGRMPGFETRLNPDQINAVTEFIWTDLASR